jgi:hypothetical protein
MCVWRLDLVCRYGRRPIVGTHRDRIAAGSGLGPNVIHTRRRGEPIRANLTTGNIGIVDNIFLEAISFVQLQA